MMDWREMVTALACVGACLFLMLRVTECTEAGQQQRNEQALECIKAGIYCGKPSR